MSIELDTIATKLAAMADAKRVDRAELRRLAHKLSTLHKQLDDYQDSLARQRDRTEKEAEAKTYDGTRMLSDGYAGGYTIALSMLHGWTGGAYGVAREDQDTAREVAS